MRARIAGCVLVGSSRTAFFRKSSARAASLSAGGLTCKTGRIIVVASIGLRSLTVWRAGGKGSGTGAALALGALGIFSSLATAAGCCGARAGMTGGREGNFRADAPGADLASSGATPSAVGGTAGGALDRVGGGGGSFERTGAGGTLTLGGALTFAGPAVAARLLRTGGGGGVERGAAPERGPPALGFFVESPSSAIRESRA